MHHGTTTDLRALRYSEANESLMDWGMAAKIGLKTEPLTQPIKASVLNGHELFTIAHITDIKNS